MHTSESHPNDLPSTFLLSGESFDFRFNQAPNERLFAALCRAYGPSGGVAWGEDLARLMSDWLPELRMNSLARMIAAKDVFHFQWRGSPWVPMMQFDLRDMSIDVGVRRIRHELGEHLDGWEVAAWFVCPNEQIAFRRPVELMRHDLDGVLAAARAERILTVG